MAFLVDTADAKVVARDRVEKRSFWASGGVMHFGEQTRIVHELHVMWPVDASGGEVPPLTWSYGGETYDFETGESGIGYENQLGVYTAVYVIKDVWA